MSRSRLNEDVGGLLANKCCVFAMAGAALGSAAALALTGGAAMGLTAGAIGMTGAVIGGGLAAGALGAGLGAGTAALTGGDVGKGALYGGIGGAITGGIGGALAGPGTSAVLAGTGAAGQAASKAMPIMSSAFPAAGNVAAQAATGAGRNLLTQGAESSASQIAPTIAPNASGIATEAAPSMFKSGASYLWNAAKAHPAQALQGVALVGQGINSLTPLSTAPLGPQQNQMAPSNIHLSPNYQRSTPLAYYAEGGITDVGTPGMFPQSQATPNRYAAPTQLPAQALHLQRTINDNFDPRTRTFTGKGFADGGPINKYYLAGLQQAQAAQQQQQAAPQQAVPVQPQTPPQPLAAPIQQAGIAGPTQGYARGRLISGLGDGVSDDIKATIDGSQPARLASNEYVIPARAVSELGNGSSDAGAKELDKMVQRIQQTRKKTIGKGKIAVDAKARKVMPV